MVRTLLRVLLLVIILAAVAAFFIGYRLADRDRASSPESAVGTVGDAVDTDRDRRDSPLDVDRARDAGAQVGERVAEGANRAQRLAIDAGLTAKIKSKMALDDTIKAADIDVDTADGVVTLRGTVESPQQRERALQLARETEGVTTVNDLLTIH